MCLWEIADKGSPQDRSRHKMNRQRGFTLIELLVVMAIY